MEGDPMRWTYLLSSVVSVAIIGGAATAHAQEKSKTTKSEMKATQKPATKAATAEEKAEHKAFDMAEADPGKVLKGVKLTSAEKAQVTEIKKKYRTQLTDLRKSHEAAEKAGKETDAQIAAKIQAIVDQENA